MIEIVFCNKINDLSKIRDNKNIRYSYLILIVNEFLI